MSAPTARQNIERALRHTYLFDLVEVTGEAEDRIYAVPHFDAELLCGMGWTEDPKCVARKMHEGAVESYREPGAVMPALQITFLKDGKVDIDLDLAAPLGGDVASAVVHFCEVVWHKVSRTKSNQQRMAEWLNRRFPDDGELARYSRRAR